MSTQPAPTSPKRPAAPAKKTATAGASNKPPAREAAAIPAARASGKAPAAKAPATTVRPPAAPAKPAAKAPARPAPKEAGLPALRFHHSHALREKTLVVLAAIETGPGVRKHGESLADLVAELVQAGMDWYFLRPLQRAQVGFMAEQSAKLGLNTATKMINSASRGFILRMDHQQLQVVAGYIREIS